MSFQTKTMALCVGLGFILATATSARADEPKNPEATTATTGATAAAETESEPPTLRLPRCGDQESEGELRTSTGCSGVFGLRSSVTDMKGGSADRGAGVMVSAEGEEFLRRRIFSAHGMHRLGLGGGGAGFEGTLLGAMAIGVRIPVGERHGPVLRAGVHGYLRGNDAFYASLFELPQLQLGYQYMRGTTVLELGGTSGVILVGRERAGEATRRILGNGFEIGAYTAVQGPWFRIGIRAMQLPSDDLVTSSVRTAEGTMCGIVSPIAVCADARVARMNAFTGAPNVVEGVTAVNAGFSIGFTRER